MANDSLPRHGGDTHSPNVPPRQREEEVEKTIDPQNEADEASYESFPASDPPTFMGKEASSVGPAEYAGGKDDDEEEDE